MAPDEVRVELPEDKTQPPGCGCVPTFDDPYRVDPATGRKSAFLTDPTGVLIQLIEGHDQY